MNWQAAFGSGVVVRSRAELIDSGATGLELTRAVLAGELLRVRRGIYAMPGTAEPIIRSVRIGGRLACLSALQAAGVWVFDAPFTHLHLVKSKSRSRSPRNRHEKLTALNRDGCELHWRQLVDPAHAVGHVVSPVDAMIQATLCQPADHAIASLDSALHIGFITRSELDLVFFHLPARLQYLRALVDGRCESGLESAFRLMLIDAGIPFQVQVRIAGVGRVDFVLDGRVVVETDGVGYHGAVTAERDYDRDLALATKGFLVIRLNYRQVFYDPTVVIAAVRASLRSHHPVAIS